MEFQTFTKILSLLKESDATIDAAYKLKIDLIEFNEPLQRIIEILISEIYGEEGHDWFTWYCYDNEWGKKGANAWDADKNPICYDDRSLWEYLEKNK